MRTRVLSSFILLFCLSLALLGCDRIPEEGTIVYDVDFPRADSDEAQGGSGGGGGSSNGSTPSGLNTSASVSVTTINEGATDTESFVLSGPPNGTVTITFSTGDTSEATLSPATMTFDNSTWNIPQSLTITAPEDYSVDGNQTTTISYTIASTDPTDTLHGAAGNFNVITADSGATAVTVANNSPSLTEGTTDNSTTFQLSGPPNGTVTVTLTSSDTGEATVSPSTMTFDNTTWNVPQTITLSGVEDYLIDGNQSSTISYTLSSTDTTEPFHNAYGSFSASIVDSGTRLFAVSDDSPTVNEGYSDNVTFVLDSAPAGTVTVNISSADDNETTVSPTTLTFNSGNYNVAQTITLYGPEDYIIDGDQQTVVTLALTSTNPADVVHNVSTSITVTTVDSRLGTTFSLSNNSPSTTEGTTDNSTTFVLLSPPKGTVTVTFSSADDNETVVSPNTLTLTPANWNVPQALPLVGVEDFIADNNTTTAMNVSFSSTDPTDGVHGESGSFNVITVDSGITGTFTLSPTNPSVAEGSSNNSSTFVLTSPPNGTVTVTLSSDNSSELGVSPTNLVFTPADWNVPQTITLTGVEDFNADGPQSTNINISYSSSDTTDGIHGQSSSFAVNVTDSGTGATTITSAVAGDQQVTLNWSGPAGMSSYTIYYTSDGSTPTTSSDNITVSDGTATSYVLGGLTGGLTYNFSIVANLGVDSSNLEGPVAASPTSFTGCNTSGTLADTDPDLLVHYDFNNNLNDVHNKDGDGRYNLQNTGGTIKFAQGCGYSNAAYFDPSTGYAYNDNFVDDNESALSGNFTVTMWINGDADNTQYSAVYSTGNKTSKNHQLDVDSAGTPQIRLLVYNDVNFSDPAQITNGQWYHVAVTHNTSNQWEVFKNGVSVGTGTSGAAATWDQLKIGVNRNTHNYWKGYIDEFKVFGRAFDVDDVKDACLLYGECKQYVAPATPDNLTATNVGDGTSVNVSWNAVNGVDNYTVYWTDNASLAIDPDNASTYTGSATVNDPTTSATATGLTPGGNYDFTVIATNSSSTGSSSPATEVNLSTNPTVPTGLTATSPDNSTINLSWNASTGADNYTVYWNTNPYVTIDPSTPATYTGSITVSTPTTSTSLTGLNGGSSYGVAVVATNSAGTSNTSAMTAETIPAAPTGLTASNTSTGTTMDLSWSPSTGADNYTVYWSDNSPDNVTIDPDNASTFDGSQTFTISQLSNCSGTCRGTATGLDNGTNYDFTVVATNTGGNSSPATEVNATPVYVAPGITVTHNAGPTPQNTHDNQTMVNEAGYATGFVEWSVTGTGYGVGNWADITRDSAGSIYHTQYYNGYPTVIKRNSVGVEQCSSSLTGVSIVTGTMEIGGLEIDSENNAYLIGETNSGINGETALGLTDVVVVKFSSECSGGTLPTIWTKQIGTSADDRAEVARIHNDVLYIRANTRGDWGATHSGERTSQNYPLRESVHLKMDTDGNILSNTQINESIDTYTLRNMVIDSNGDYYETGTAFWFVGYANLATTTKSIDGEDCSVQDWSTGNLRCSVIRKYNSNHVRQWTKTFATKETVFQSIQLNSDETKIITVGTSRTDFNGVTKTPTHISSYHYPILVNSISPTNGSINWTKFTGQSGGGYNQGTPFASRYMREGENALGLDESDNIFIAHKIFFYNNEMPNGGNHSRQFNRITKLDSDGNSIWSRAFGGEKKQYSSGNVPSENLYSTHVTKGGQIYLTGSNSYGQDSFNPKGSKLYKIDGSFDNYTTPMLDAEVGFDYFTLNLTGPTPTQNVTWNWTSDNTSQMITMYGVAATPGQVNNEHLWITGRPNDPIYVYVAAIQDNVSDGDTVVNVNISTTSADSNWNGLNFTVPVTVIDQSQTFPNSDPYVTLGFDNGSITEGNSGTQTRTLRATLDTVATSTVTINLTDNATCSASNSSDFTYPASITIPAGQSEGADNVTINGDTTFEGDETACIDVASITNGIEDGTQQARLKIVNDDPLPDPTSLTATGGEQQVKLTWTKVTGADFYRFYWAKRDGTINHRIFVDNSTPNTYDGSFDVQGQNTTLFIHGGLATGDYHYVMTARTNEGYASTQFPDSSAAAKAGTATSFTTVTRVTDNDPNLRVYYDFDNSSGNGLANKSTQPASPAAYDLSLAGNATIIFGGSHFNSDQAAYFDANGGYAHNDNFSDSNESLDNFTISMWVRPDEDMTTYASILATADSNGAGKFQISDNGSLGIVAMTDNKRQWLEAGTVPIDNWTHVVAVKNSSLVDNGTLTFYLNGLVGSNNMLYCPDNTKDTCADNNSLTDFDTAWDKIKLGINRQSQNAWKGYIDEVKVYNRSLSAQEVCNLYKNHGPLNTGATCP